MEHIIPDYPYALGICRIEPENNIHVIIEAFEEELPLRLVMVGNWLNSDYGKELYEKCRKNPLVSALTPIYDQDYLSRLRAGCALYLHGHSCGGTNPSLVEAMYHSLAIASFDVNFNRETTENGAFYFKTPQELRDIIRNTSTAALADCASRMGETARCRYTWKRISELYAGLF